VLNSYTFAYDQDYNPYLQIVGSTTLDGRWNLKTTATGKYSSNESELLIAVVSPAEDYFIVWNNCNFTSPQTIKLNLPIIDAVFTQTQVYPLFYPSLAVYVELHRYALVGEFRLIIFLWNQQVISNSTVAPLISNILI
jgi:hypothetical protein